MPVTVETLEKLERKITLTLPADVIKNEVESRLKRMSRQVKMDGFRPGKVPMNVVAQRYGYSVQYEVLNDKVGEAFAVAANEAKLRVAGQPRISEKEGAPEGELNFEAIFEVYPEVKLGNLADTEVEKLTAEVLGQKLEERHTQNPDLTVQFEVDESVNYGKAAADYQATLSFLENRVSGLRKALRGD